MKKNDVKINGVYAVKVGRNTTGVRIMKENPHGGWDGVNIATNKAIRIKSPTRLHGPYNPKAKQKTPATSATKTPTSAPVEKTKAKSAKDTKAAKETNMGQRVAKTKRPSGLDAAAGVLAQAGQPLSAGEMVKQMLDQNLWQTKGQTPAATIYAAIIREIATKGKTARFRKVERGKFTLAK